MEQISDELEVLEIKQTNRDQLIYMFCAFTISKALEESPAPKELAHSGIALGYSAGDELILGHFVNGKFLQNIKLIEEGIYAKESSCQEPEFEPDDRGDLWEYLHFNYRTFLEEQGCDEQFYRGGELEAISICEKFKEHIYVNRCLKCDFIKKTPRARLCLNCGDFLKDSPS